MTTTKALTPGTRVYTQDWDGLVLLSMRPAGVVRTVERVERNVSGGGKATNRVFFTDGTSALAAASSTWIEV